LDEGGTASFFESVDINSPVVFRYEDQVWFEDRWMVASLCDE
jgi:hypothetical protein